MTNAIFEVLQSAPACQLNRTGTASSYGLLSQAVKDLPDDKLEDLEEDLEFHAKTGLVGTHMSWLLSLMTDDVAA